MGLLDSIVGQVSDTLSDTDNSKQIGLMDIINLINNPQTGGIQGLVSTFEEKGLGGVVASWIGTGQNLAISGEQLEAVIGNTPLQGLAEKFGLSSQDVSSHLAQLLPQVIDQLSPSGTLPEGNQLEGALGLLKNFMK